MSAPIIWIFLPALVGFGLYFIRRRARLMHSLGVVCALLLAAAAWWAPIGEPINLRLWAGLPTITIADTIFILGRQIMLDTSLRPWLALIYTSASFWFTGAYTARVHSLFLPLGLIVTAAITATLAIQPSVYSVLIYAILALLCVPLLAVPGKPVPAGILRFMTFQTIGVALLLLADWLLPIALVNPGNAAQNLQAVLFLCLGFALISAILPFHTWIPMLTKETHPYTAAFVFTMISLDASLLGMEYLERFGELETIAGPLENLILIAGIAMILAAGLWAAFESDLGRILGFGLVSSMGLNLISIYLMAGGSTGVNPETLFGRQIIPAQLGFAIWALALAMVRRLGGNLQFRSVQGLGFKLPVATAGITLASFSLAGLPLLASFPTLLTHLTFIGLVSPALAGAALTGQAFLMAAAIRSVAVLILEPSAVAISENATASLDDTVPVRLPDANLETRPSEIRPQESRMQRLLILSGCFLLIITGLVLIIPALTG